MAEFTLVRPKKGGRLIPFTKEDGKIYRRFLRRRKALEPGELMVVSYVEPRNLLHHRKFFALVGYVAENSDTYDNKDKALLAIKIAAGHCDFIPDPVNGGLTAVPRSISFAKMEQGDFDKFYNNALEGICQHVLKHMNKVDLQEALENVARFGD
jgi:hypothetical protein